MVPHNKQKALFNKYCNELGEKIKNEKKSKKVKRKNKGILYIIIFTNWFLYRNQKMNLKSCLYPK